MRRNSIYIAFVLGGALLGERVRRTPCVSSPQAVQCWPAACEWCCSLVCWTLRAQGVRCRNCPAQPARPMLSWASVLPGCEPAPLEAPLAMAGSQQQRAAAEQGTPAQLLRLPRRQSTRALTHCGRTITRGCAPPCSHACNLPVSVCWVGMCPASFQEVHVTNMPCLSHRPSLTLSRKFDLAAEAV